MAISKQEFIRIAKDQGRSKEEILAKLNELDAEGFFDAPAEEPVQEEAPAPAQPEPEAEPERELSTVERIMTYGEAALSGPLFGFGEEAAALGRTGYGMAFEALDPNMEMEDFSTKYARERQRGKDVREIEQQNNPGALMATEIAASLPSAFKIGLSIPNQATRLQNVAAQGTAAAGEALVREVGAGEGGLEDRLEQVEPVNVGVGAALGGVGGAFMRGQQAVDAYEAAKAGMRKPDGTVTEKGFESQSKAEVARRAVFDDLYTNMKEDVGITEARTAVSADADATRARQLLHADDRLSHDVLTTLHDAFEASPQAAKLVSDAGAVVDGKTLSSGARLQMLDAAQAELAKQSPEAAEAFARMRTEMDMMQQELREVFPGVKFEEGYMPISFKEEAKAAPRIQSTEGSAPSASTKARDTGIVSKEQASAILNNPVQSFLGVWEDTADALAMAKRFGVTVDLKDLTDIHSYTDEVIKAIRKANVEKLGEAGADRLANGLKLFSLNGRKGMSPFFQLMRTATSAALLGTPENAMLQAGDLGVAAYNGGFLNTVKAMPSALKSMFLTRGQTIAVDGYDKMVRMADLGITRQHFGELYNQSNGGFVGAKELTKFSEVIMQGAGVTKMNRFGQELGVNSALNAMKKMTPEQLAKSQWGEGLSMEQVNKLSAALKAGDMQDPSVLEAAFFAFGRMQPGSRTAVPPRYLKMKNGRMLYSMKMFMTKIGSRMHNDVFKPYAEAYKLGINTPKGKKKLGQAMINSARYTGYIVALNAVVDPGRKQVFRGKEQETTFGEEVVRQGTAFATGGLVDTENYRGSESLAPPFVTAVFDTLELLTKDELSAEDMENIARYLPGFRQALYGKEVVERDGGMDLDMDMNMDMDMNL